MDEKVMTPDEFREVMAEIQNRLGYDAEAFHSVADTLLCKVLTELGYQEGVEIFDKARKWYG